MPNIGNNPKHLEGGGSQLILMLLVRLYFPSAVQQPSCKAGLKLGLQVG